MIEWSDDGIVLSARRHGESGAIVSLLTRSHGRHAGLVLGGAGRRARGVYEPGNRVSAVWRARLAEHLGHYACELAESRAAAPSARPPPSLTPPCRSASRTSASTTASTTSSPGSATPQRPGPLAMSD